MVSEEEIENRKMNIRYCIEYYNDNIDELERINLKIIDQKKYNTKITASYSLTGGGSKGSISSKVENHIIRTDELIDKKIKLENKIALIDNAMLILNKQEKSVLNLIKKYKNRISFISEELAISKKVVIDTRERIIRKIYDFYYEN